MLKYRILRILRSSETALTTREICCILNGKSKDYCLDVDGKGARCLWWYRRPSHEAQKIRLVKPDCRIDPRRLYTVLKELLEQGLIRRKRIYLRDNLGTWGYDRHILYYVDDSQLELRLRKEYKSVRLCTG